MISILTKYRFRLLKFLSRFIPYLKKLIMDKLEMMESVGKEISQHIKTYQNYNDFSSQSKIDVNKQDKVHHINYQFKINESGFLFNFLFLYDNGNISMNYSYDYEKILKTDEAKIDLFFRFFNSLPEKELIRIYELTEWK